MRGQEHATQELLDYRYREKFHMTQKELLEEPMDVYNINMTIMGLENKLVREQQRRIERDARRGRIG